MSSIFTLNLRENSIIIRINLKLYPLEALYGAAYIFLDKAYLFLEGESPEKILVHIKGKEKLTEKDLKNIAQDFLNELLNYSLRSKISKDNKNLREYILARALGIQTQSSIPENRNCQQPKEWKKDNTDSIVSWDKKYNI